MYFLYAELMMTYETKHVAVKHNLYYMLCFDWNFVII